MTRAWLAAGMLVAASVVTAGIAQAQEVPSAPHKLRVRQASVTRNAKTKKLEISVAYRDVFDAQAQQKLQSGLTTVVVLAAGVFRPDQNNAPVASAGVWQSCKVTFDVWNEVYRLQISRPDGERQAVALNIEGVLRRCGEIRGVELHGPLQPKQRYFVAATVEVNPVSQRMLEQIRDWVSKPPGLHATTLGQTLFSSFVGLFVARIGKADRTLSFRTQTFVVPP